MTMLIRYAGIDMAWEDVFAISNEGSTVDIIAYDKVSSYLKDEWGFIFYRYDNASLDDIYRLIDAGYPVMALQVFSRTNDTGHNRVVIGYDKNTDELILNDPSEYGANYRVSTEDFLYNWERWAEVGSWDSSNILWVLMKTGDIFPLFVSGTLLPVEMQLDYLPESGPIWATVSHITAMIRYAGIEISTDQVYTLLGDPPVLNYAAVDEYLQENYNRRFVRYDDISFEDIELTINRGKPVMILQCWTPDGDFGNTRLCIGCMPGKSTLIIRDAQENSMGHQFLTKYTCEELWADFQELNQGWPSKRFYWIVE